MNYYTSTIVQHPNSLSSLLAAVEWFQQTQDAQHHTALTPESIKNNAHILLLNQAGESIKIADIRDLKEKLSYSTYTKGNVQYFVLLDAHKLTTPAQNALLKSIEEPPVQTHIVLVTSNPDALLPTIRSRCNLEQIRSSGAAELQATQHNTEIAQLYKKLTSASEADKIELAANYKERSDAQQLCTQLIEHLHAELKKPQKEYSTKAITSHSQRLLTALEQLDQNVNVLLVLENCFFELE